MEPGGGGVIQLGNGPGLAARGRAKAIIRPSVKMRLIKLVSFIV